MNKLTASLPDAIGIPCSIDDWVAFYNTGPGRTIFGKIVSFNNVSMVVRPDGKKNTIRKHPRQVLKIPPIEKAPVVVFDAIGQELKVGDWVAMTKEEKSHWHGYKTYDYYNGNLVFGEITNLGKSTIAVRIRNKKNSLKKFSNQLVKVSLEQVTLLYLAF